MGGVGGGMGGGMPNVPGTAFGGAIDPSSLQKVSGLRLVPSIQVSERYDSNVFFAPKRLLQGLAGEDFVTIAVPQVRGLYADQRNLVKMNAAAGAVGSYYVNNAGLNYVGANAGVGLDMSNLLSQWRPGSRWMVFDTFFITPQPPSFFLGDQSAGEQVHPLVAGFQATRVNTTSNSFNTMFELPIYEHIKLTASYTNSFIHYGASQVPQAATLISQHVQAYTAGLLKEVSLYDTLRVDLMGNEFDLGVRGAFSARGGTFGWTHRFSQTVSVSAAGGAQLLSGQANGSPFSLLAPVGSLAILWVDAATSITLAYRSGITPSFQFQGAALLNHTVSFNITQNTPIHGLVGLLGVNYSVASEYGSNSGAALSWTTVSGMTGLQYRVTQKMFSTLSYGYQNVDNVLAGTHFAYDKHFVQLSLVQAFY